MSLFSKLFQSTAILDLTGFTDWHCHILPGVDDGVRTMRESLEILSCYESLGITEVWLTPHIMEDIPNTTTTLKARFQELRDAYDGNIYLHLASENMLDNLFLERLEADDLLPIGEDGKTLLVETSYFNAPIRLNEMFEAIKAKGYTPLFAHPERYNYINSFSTYRKLYEEGVRFQINLMSLTGYYGGGGRRKAMELLTAGYIDRFGSDLHRKEHLDIIGNIKIDKAKLTTINTLISC